GGGSPWRAHGDQGVPAGDDRASAAADAVSPGVADPAGIAGGVPLIAAPSMGSESARHWMIVAFACLFVFSAVGNAWGTRGKHFGWILLSAVAALAVAGY